MRFRRRPEPESQTEHDEDSAWARPNGSAADVGGVGDARDSPPVNGVAGAGVPELPEYPDLPEYPGSPEYPDLPEYPGSPEPLDDPGSAGSADNPYERLAAGLAEVTAAPAPPDEPVRAEEPVRLIGGGSAEDRPVWPPRPVPVPADDPAPARPSWRGQAPPFVADGAVRAAGGVVWSRWGRQLRVLLIHRPKYDDWSLPKGKADPGESDTACALREVKEETGLSCSLGDELGAAGYTDRHGRPKTVRYWAMQPVGGSFVPHAEVDQIRWLSVDEAARLCSYQRDAEVLAGFAAAQETSPS